MGEIEVGGGDCKKCLGGCLEEVLLFGKPYFLILPLDPAPIRTEE